MLLQKLNSQKKMSQNGKFHLQWNDFQLNVSNSFTKLRRDSKLHDVTLVTSDMMQVSAHRFVLAACSEFFKTVFENNYTNHNPLIILENISYEEINLILDYIYEGEINIFQGHLDRFLEIAKKFMLNGLVNEDNYFKDSIYKQCMDEMDDDVENDAKQNLIDQTNSPRSKSGNERSISNQIMDDFEFSYIGESANQEELDGDQEDNLNEDFESQSTHVNEGKRIRGTDMVWTKKVNFNSPEDFLKSNILDEIKETYTSKRKREHEIHKVHNYVCHFSQRQKYLPCKKQLRIVFPSDSKEVFVQETGVHEHIENPDFVETSHVFKWSKKATDILVTGIKMNSRPKVMLCELRDKHCFDGQNEPSQMQIYNKIAHLKKIMNFLKS